MKPQRWLVMWCFGFGAAECISMTCAAGLSLYMMYLFEEVGGPSGAWALSYAILIGIWEGLILGEIQGVLLRSRFPNLSVKNWIKWTITATTIGWIAGITLSAMADTLSGNPVLTPIGGTSPLLIGALMGAALGAIIGGFQSKELKHHTPHAKSWVIANIVAWTAAMTIIMGSTMFPTQTASTAIVIITAGLGGLAAGLTAGMITSIIGLIMTPGE